MNLVHHLYARLYVLLYTIYSKFLTVKNKSPVYLSGKTAVVTGGNAGIGFEVCLDLASRGCRVIIADKDDSTETRNKIIKLSNNPNILSKILDLGSFKSIRNFAADINKNEDRLDILVNNAGIGATKSLQTEDGFNPIMQVNYLGPFLLTHLLIDILKKSSPSRIIFTSSALAFNVYFKPMVLRDNQPCDGLLVAHKMYANSKFATIVAADIFAEKLKDSGVTSNSLHPGFIKTSIYNQFYEIAFKPSSLLIHISLFFFGKSVWEGAQTTIHLSVSQQVENITGKYFWNSMPSFKPPRVCDEDLRKEVWRISEECVKLAPNEKI